LNGCTKNGYEANTNDATMKIVNYKDMQISYTEAGTGDTTLFFVHGSFLNKEYWDEQIKFFSPTYHIIAIDLPGHGQSTKGSDSLIIQKFGDAVISVIKDLKLEKVILIGHSMGSDVILECAVKYPDPIIGFVVIDYFKNVGTPLPTKIADQVLTGLKKDFSKTMEMYVRTGLVTKNTDSTVVNRVIRDYLNMDQAGAIESVADGFRYAPREKELVERLEFKVYLINVDYMPTNEDLLKASLHERYALTTIHGTSHFPMIEDADGFNQALQKVIKELDQK
jgi:sigma-B regulation protein RsbQ